MATWASVLLDCLDYSTVDLLLGNLFHKLRSFSCIQLAISFSKHAHKLKKGHGSIKQVGVAQKFSGALPHALCFYLSKHPHHQNPGTAPACYYVIMQASNQTRVCNVLSI